VADDENKSTKSTRSLKSLLSRKSNKSSEPAVDGPSMPSEVDVAKVDMVVVSVNTAEEAEAEARAVSTDEKQTATDEKQKMDELKDDLKKVLQVLKEKEEACAAAQSKVQEYKSMAKTAVKSQRELELAFAMYEAQSGAKDEAEVVAHRVLDECKKRQEAMKASSFSFDEEIKSTISEISDYCQNKSEDRQCEMLGPYEDKVRDWLAPYEDMLFAYLVDLLDAKKEEEARSKPKKA